VQLHVARDCVQLHGRNNCQVIVIITNHVLARELLYSMANTQTKGGENEKQKTMSNSKR